MINRISAGVILLAISCGSAVAASFDGSEPLLCAATTVNECLPIEGCTQVVPQAVAAPNFIRFDFSANTLMTTDAAGSERKSTIKRSETVDGKLILQGAEDGVEGVRDGMGWTIAISQDSGRMVVTAAGDDVAITIFGACTTL
jgi:hypothetical protein